MDTVNGSPLQKNQNPEQRTKNTPFDPARAGIRDRMPEHRTCLPGKIMIKLTSQQAARQALNNKHGTPNNKHETTNTEQQTRNNKHETPNNNQIFPNQAMLNFHPQRWNDKPLPWLKELVWQNVKNQGKRLLKAVRNER